MELTDVIRRHEAPKPVEDDPLQPLRNFFETPGVMQGCMAAAVCLGIFVPARKSLLRVADQQMKLGVILPDLIVTPTMALFTAQCSLFAGSVYGSAAYLQRLAEMSAEQKSPTVDAICNDPVVVTALGNPMDSWFDAVDNNGSNSSWDPREQAVSALQCALKACRERREYQEREAAASDTTTSSSNDNGLSFWR
jgi:hypothetical protein